MKLKSTFAVLLSILLLLAISNPLVAQSSGATAKLTGVVTDSTAFAVSGVKITAHRDGEASANAISITSSTDGSYSWSLPPGQYQVQFSHESFATRTVPLTLSPGETRSLNIRLELESLSSSVVVTGQTEPVREEQTAAPTDIITRETIEARQSVGLPDLLLYSTGVTFGRTGANGGTASLFLNGGNSNFTKVLVDGTPVNPPGSAVDFSLLTTDNV